MISQIQFKDSYSIVVESGESTALKMFLCDRPVTVQTTDGSDNHQYHTSGLMQVYSPGRALTALMAAGV